MRKTIGRLLGLVLFVLIPTTACVTLYGLVSEHEVTAFWELTPGALMLYGQEPETKYAQSFGAVARTARSKGFVFTDPQLVETNGLFNLWYLRWQRSYTIAVSEEGNRLLIDGLWMVRFDDSDLECIMAHELGHVIQLQGRSADHPAVQRMSCLDSQQFADGIGRLLCGFEQYQTMMRRYIKNRPMVVRQCSATDPVL